MKIVATPGVEDSY